MLSEVFCKEGYSLLGSLPWYGTVTPSIDKHRKWRLDSEKWPRVSAWVFPWKSVRVYICSCTDLFLFFLEVGEWGHNPDHFYGISYQWSERGSSSSCATALGAIPWSCLQIGCHKSLISMGIQPLHWLKWLEPEHRPVTKRLITVTWRSNVRWDGSLMSPTIFRDRAPVNDLALLIMIFPDRSTGTAVHWRYTLCIYSRRCGEIDFCPLSEQAAILLRSCRIDHIII